MADHDHGFAQAFRAGCADVVLADHLQHARARKPRDDTRVRKTERECGEPDLADRAEPARPPDLEIERPLCEVVEPDGEDQEQKSSNYEARHAVADHRGGRQEVVDPRVLADGRHDAEQHAKADREDEGKEANLRAYRQLAEHQWGDGDPSVDEGFAKVAVQEQAGQEARVLLPERPVQAVVMEYQRVLRSVQVFVEQGVAGEPVDPKEDDR